MVHFTGIAMFWCYEITYLLRWFLDVRSLPWLSLRPQTSEKSCRRRTFGPHPSHVTELALGLSFAIEYPLIVAFHPWVQYSGVGYGTSILRPMEAITQFLIFSATEEILKPHIMWFLAPCGGPAETKHSLNGSHSAACGLTIDYLLPKATLCFAIMTIRIVSVFTKLTGELQMFPIIIWVVVRQFRGRLSFSCPYGLI